MAAIEILSTSLDLLASSTASSSSCHYHYCPSVFARFRVGPVLDISSIARATLGLTQPNKIDPPKISFAAKEIDLVEWKGDILAVGVTEKDMAKDENLKFKNLVLQKLDSHLGGLLYEVSSEEDFAGKSGQSIILRLPGLGLIGLGSASATLAYRDLGEAVAAASKSTTQSSNVAITLASSEGLSLDQSQPLLQQLLLGLYWELLMIIGLSPNQRYQSSNMWIFLDLVLDLRLRKNLIMPKMSVQGSFWEKNL